MKNFITTYFFAFALGIGALSAQTYVVSVGNYDLDGESAFLGVRSDDISREKAKKLGFSNYYGDYVTKVIKNTAAEKAGIQPNDVDFIIFATLSPDYYFPGSGVLLQREMGMQGIGALDIRNQCSGFIYGLSIAD
ncbi:MAG: hypothetical protein AAGH79_18560, partial [Bacteroidota bacterium]